jgi:hypothetical protein
MDERYFSKPQFIDPKLEFTHHEWPGTSVVKEVSAGVEPTGEDSFETEHFFIKQFNVDAHSLAALGEPYFSNEVVGTRIQHAKKCLVGEGNGDPTPTQVTKKMADLFDRFEYSEDLVAKVTTVLESLDPKEIVKAAKRLYEKHKRWYGIELPDFIINKLYVVGKGADDKKHAYVIKKKVKSSEDDPFCLDLGEAFSRMKQDFIAKRLGVGEEESWHREADKFIKNLRKYLPDPRLRANLADELKKFVGVTCRVMDEEGEVIDLGYVHMGANIRITPKGELRMIDTDRTKPAIVRGVEDDPKKILMLY